MRRQLPIAPPSSIEVPEVQKPRFDSLPGTRCAAAVREEADLANVIFRVTPSTSQLRRVAR
jgi:hypothetical protein